MTAWLTLQSSQADDGGHNSQQQRQGFFKHSSSNSNNKESIFAHEEADTIVRESTDAVIEATIANSASAEGEKLKTPLSFEERKFSDAAFDDFGVDNNGNPTGVFGTPWNEKQAEDGLQPLAKKA